jgi:hypothetical protein
MNYQYNEAKKILTFNSADSTKLAVKFHLPAERIGILVSHNFTNESTVDSLQLLKVVRNQFKERKLELVSVETPENEIFNQLLLQAGFSLRTSKVHVARELAEMVEPVVVSATVTYASLHSVGEEVFIPLITAASQGDPFEDSSDSGEEDFRELVASAGKAFTPQGWFVAFVDREPAGVFLPQRYEDQPELGTIYYLGILPEYRKRGLGRKLHAEGLNFLREMGAKKYVGSTDKANHGMINIFEKNGCHKTRVQCFYLP